MKTHYKTVKKDAQKSPMDFHLVTDLLNIFIQQLSIGFVISYFENLIFQELKIDNCNFPESDLLKPLLVPKFV